MAVELRSSRRYDRSSEGSQDESSSDQHHDPAQTPVEEPYPKYRPHNMTRSPVILPWKRRLETLAVLGHSTSLILFTFWFFFFWCFPILWPLMIIYTVYYLLDRTPSNGLSASRRSMWLRNSYIYKLLCSYFPITLHKMCDLKPTFETKTVERLRYDTVWDGWLPDRILDLMTRLGVVKMVTKKVETSVRTGPRYIFGYHPHGILAMGVTGGFATEGAHFSKMFPGIRCLVTTLINQFQLPFYRDYLLGLGVTSVTRANLNRVIQHDSSVVIVVGGALESLYSRPGLNTLVLNKRRGFIKLALTMCGHSDTECPDDDNDMALVPVYGFGENNVYDVYYTNDEIDAEKEGWLKRALRAWQLWLKRIGGFTLPIVVSRGIFNYDFGLLPFRRPIDVVFGRPITVKRLVEKDENGQYGDVTDAEIDHYHRLYVEELQRLFQENRSKLSSWDEDLKIVE